jgi:succinoglycan biosynthesis protein ExoA
MIENPIVSVVVPVRNSQKHVRQLVDSLLQQDYKGEMEIILAGGRNDETWTAIQEYIDEGKVTIVEVDNPEGWVWRDANRKRNAAAAQAKGAVLAFTDSKIQHPSDWISTGVRLLRENNVQAVAGIMVASPTQESSFLAAYTDKALLRRHPSFGKGRLLTAKNFGESESLPATSNFFILRDTFLDIEGGAPEEVAISYEDYALAWELVRMNSNTILCTDELWVFHDHRSKFRDVVKEHRRSGRAAAQFSALYPDCPYAQRRKRQVTIVAGVTGIAAIVSVAAVALAGVEAMLVFLALGIAGFVFLGLVNAVSSKDWRALLFPPFMIFFGLAFSYSFIDGWHKGGNLALSDAKYLQT